MCVSPSKNSYEKLKSDVHKYNTCEVNKIINTLRAVDFSEEDIEKKKKHQFILLIVYNQDAADKEDIRKRIDNAKLKIKLNITMKISV